MQRDNDRPTTLYSISIVPAQDIVQRREQRELELLAILIKDNYSGEAISSHFILTQGLVCTGATIASPLLSSNFYYSPIKKWLSSITIRHALNSVLCLEFISSLLRENDGTALRTLDDSSEDDRE